MSFIAAAGAVIGVVGGISKAVGASKKKKEAQEAQKKAKAEMDAKKKQYEALDTSNLAANQQNKMENLTINQKGAQLAAQKGEQSRANIMQQMSGAAGASGIAALAQQMAGEGQKAAQQAGATIGDQEAANQAKAAAEASRLQTQELAGAKEARNLEYDKTGNLLEMASGEHAAAGAAADAAEQQKQSAIGGIGKSLLGGVTGGIGG